MLPVAVGEHFQKTCNGPTVHHNPSMQRHLGRLTIAQICSAVWIQAHRKDPSVVLVVLEIVSLRVKSVAHINVLIQLDHVRVYETGIQHSRWNKSRTFICVLCTSSAVGILLVYFRCVSVLRPKVVHDTSIPVGAPECHVNLVHVRAVTNWEIHV